MVALKDIGIIFIIIIALVSVILIVLIIIEKRMNKKASKKVYYTKNETYIEKISKLDLKNPTKALKAIDKLARNFFREAFKTKGAPEYSELEEEFKKKNNKKVAEFCDSMDKLLYSGKSPSQNENQKLIKNLAEIIGSNKIMTKKEKAFLDKKSIQIEKKLKLLHFFRKMTGRSKENSVKAVSKVDNKK